MQRDQVKELIPVSTVNPHYRHLKRKQPWSRERAVKHNKKTYLEKFRFGIGGMILELV